MATMPTHGFRHVVSTRPWFNKLRCTSSLASLPSPSPSPLTGPLDSSYNSENGGEEEKDEASSKTPSYFPKRGQTVELTCESLAFKGKGVCKVAETGFVVMCDRALPGERFVGRVTTPSLGYDPTTYPNHGFINWRRTLTCQVTSIVKVVRGMQLDQMLCPNTP